MTWWQEHLLCLQTGGCIYGTINCRLYQTLDLLYLITLLEEDLDLDHSQWEDIHVVTGALKMFFRELPEPLFPFNSFQPFVEAISEFSLTNSHSLRVKLWRFNNININIKLDHKYWNHDILTGWEMKSSRCEDKEREEKVWD